MNAQAQAAIGEKGKETVLERCGVVMPISTTDGLPAEHWQEVLSIVQEAICDSGFEPVLVRTADEANLIRKNNVQNTYSSPIMVFDVSGKNPNVLFELGLRLAFDKPTIIIKDDATNYNFDASSVESITYPRGLRYTPMVAFKEALRTKITQAFKTYRENPSATMLFKELEDCKSEKAASKNPSTEKFILDSIGRLVEEVKYIKDNLQEDSSQQNSSKQSQLAMNTFTDIFLRPENLEIFVTSKIDQFVKVTGLKNRSDIDKQYLQSKVFEFIVSSNPELDNDVIERLILEVINRQIKVPASSTMVA